MPGNLGKFGDRADLAWITAPWWCGWDGGLPRHCVGNNRLPYVQIWQLRLELLRSVSSLTASLIQHTMSWLKMHMPSLNYSLHCRSIGTRISYKHIPILKFAVVSTPYHMARLISQNAKQHHQWLKLAIISTPYHMAGVIGKNATEH